MLVEDEAAIRELLFEVLVGDGFEIVEAGTCDAAFLLLERADLQLLLIDINMPGRLDGIAPATLVRVTHPSLPVVFTLGNPDSANRARKLGDPSAVVDKPFKLCDLLTTVRRLVDA
jgi:two-component system, response regulator PdtaR